MPITDAEWEQIESADGLFTSVQALLSAGAPQAYAVEDFFRDVSPEAPDEFELLHVLLNAVSWQVSRHRSELLVELALETLVFHSYVEKKVVQRDGESIAYYRALTGQPDYAEGEALGTVQPTTEIEASVPDSPELTPQEDHQPAHSPQ